MLVDELYGQNQSTNEPPTLPNCCRRKRIASAQKAGFLVIALLGAIGRGILILG
jgi:hypothetical protein